MNNKVTMDGMIGQSNLFMAAYQDEHEKKVTVIYNGKESRVSVEEAERIIKLGGKLKDGEKN